MVRPLLALCAVTMALLATGSVAAQVFLSEIVVNPPGLNRGGEVIEIRGPAAASLAGYRFIQIDGDQFDRGRIRVVLDLGAFSLGANGLLVVRLNPVGALVPPPDADSIVVDVTTPAGQDLDNGASTFVLGSGVFPFSVGGDLDVDNNGVVDTAAASQLAGFAAADAVSYFDSIFPIAQQAQYAAFFGGVELGARTAQDGLPLLPQALTRVLECDEDSIWQGGSFGGWAGGEIARTAEGAYRWAVVRNFGFVEASLANPETRVLRLGGDNERFCPGACCLSDGTCIQTSRESCAALKGEYLGDFSLCPDPPTTPPVIVVVPDDEFCIEQKQKQILNGDPVITLSVSSEGGLGQTLRWYVGGCGEGKPIGEGNPLELESLPEETTTYFARWETRCGSVSECASVTITIRTAPPDVSFLDSSNGEPTLDIIACVGDTLTLSADVSGATTIEWRFFSDGGSGVALPFNKETITIGPLTAESFGRYVITGRNACGSDAVAFEVALGDSPVIKQQPTAPPPLCAGAGFTLTVAVASDNLEGPSFQWRVGGVDILGATSSSLVIDPAGSADSGVYECEIVDGCGTIRTNPVTVVVDDVVPSITTQPTIAGPVCAGDPITLTVAATDGEAFQWRLDGTPIQGATSATLTIDPSSPASAGSYDCVVSNGCGPRPSAAVEVVINDGLPVVGKFAPPLPLCVGDALSVTIPLTSGGPAQFQWRLDGAPLATQTAATLSIASVALTDAGSYDAVITNACGTFTLKPFTVVIDAAPPVITSEPDAPDPLCVGQSFTLTVAADDAEGFVWRRNGTPIDGATSATYSVAAATVADDGSYDCQVSNGCGVTTSAAVTVIVDADVPTITQQPTAEPTACLCVGAEITLTIAADDATSFQWLRGDTEIAGATSATFTIASAALTDNGEYRCRVSNGCGFVLSNPLTVTVSDLAPVLPPVPSPIRIAVGERLALSFDFGVAICRFELVRLPAKGGEELIVGGGPGSGLVSIDLGSAEPADAGNYRFTVQNGCGSAAVEFTVVVLIDCAAPVGIGDSNGDGLINFDDISCFVSALVAQSAWDTCGTLFTSKSYVCANDVNCDGLVNFDDIGRFVECLVAGTCATTQHEIVDPLPPDTLTVTEGEDAVFTITTSGGRFFDLVQQTPGGDVVRLTVESTTSPTTLTLPAVQESDEGTYRIRVRNFCTEPRERTVQLIVVPPVVDCEAPGGIGDSNGDGLINFDDISCFVSALVAQSAWETCGTVFSPKSYLCANDVNCDGVVNFDDISRFVECLVAGRCSAGEPPTITQQPPDVVYVQPGATATISVAVPNPPGGPAYLIRWQKLIGGAFQDLPLGTIPSASLSDLSLIAVVDADAGEYRASIRDGCAGDPIFSEIAVVVIPCRTCVPGDANRDTIVNFDDISCFVAGLVSQSAWQSCGVTLDPALTPLTQYFCANDANQDGAVNFDDINRFVELILKNPCITR